MTTAPGLRTITEHVAEVLRRVPAGSGRSTRTRGPVDGAVHGPAHGTPERHSLEPVRLGLAEAAEAGVGLVLTAPVRAALPVPGFDHAAVDGYAVRLADLPPETPVALDVVRAVRAGQSPGRVPLRAGEAVRIMTGAPVPPGADAVVPVEATSTGRFAAADPDQRGTHREGPVTVTRPAKDNIRRRGEDLDVAAVLADRGAPVTPALLAAAAAAGATTLNVEARRGQPLRGPRVAVLSTGSELRPPGPDLGPGDVVDSNSLMLAAVVAAHGGVPVRLGGVPDDIGSLTAALDSLADEVDLVVTTGGVSAGAWDVVRTVLTAPGSPATDVDLTGVAMRPGRPQGLAAWRGTPWIALPGTPVAAFVAAHLFVRPALAALRGAVPPEVRRLPTSERDHTVFGPFRGRLRPPAPSPGTGDAGAGAHRCGAPGLVRIVPVVVRAGAVAPAPGTVRGSHAMSALLGAEALALVPPEGVGPGSLVDVVTL